MSRLTTGTALDHQTADRVLHAKRDSAVMLKLVDRAFGVLLVLAAIAHTFGSLSAYAFLSTELVWAFAASALAILVAAINLLRVNRPEDRTLAWICFAGCIAWIVLVLAFNVSVGNIADPRGLTHALVTAVLAFFSLRIATGKTMSWERAPT